MVTVTPQQDSSPSRDATERPPSSQSPERDHFLETPRRRGRWRRRDPRKARIRQFGLHIILIVLLALLFLVLWEGVAYSDEGQAKGAFAWELDKKPGAKTPGRPAGASTMTNAPVPLGASALAGAQSNGPQTMSKDQGESERRATQEPERPLTFSEWIQHLLEEDERRRMGEDVPPHDTASPRSENMPSSSRSADPMAEPPGTAQPSNSPDQQRSARSPAPVTPPSAPTDVDRMRGATQSIPLTPPKLIGHRTEPAGWKPEETESRRLAQITNDELAYVSSLDLILALEAEFQNLPGGDSRSELSVLRSELYHRVIDLSVQVGFTDNPRDNLDAIRVFLNKVLRIEAVQRSQPDLDLLRIGTILRTRRASDVGWSLLALAFAEKLNTYLDLEPIQVGGLLALRYRSGAHRYLLVPLHPDKLYTDREFLSLAFGSSPGSHEIRTLTRREFWGLTFGEVGAGLLQLEGEIAHASAWVDRGLNLFREQPNAHIANAKIQLERNEAEVALESLNLAVKLSPHNPDARMQRANLLGELGLDDRLVEDLRWLSGTGKHPRASLRLIRVFLRRSEFVAARKEVERLRGVTLPPSLAEEHEKIELQVEASPWVAVLRGAHPDFDRFEAVDRLRAYPLPLVYQALIESLGDTNLRLSQYSRRALAEMTGLDLPPLPKRWREALGLATPPKKP